MKYVTIKHSPAYTAQEVAASAHIPGKEMAKTVMVKLDGRLAMAVLPASSHVKFARLKNAAGVSQADYAPGAAVAEMVQAILRDEKRVLPCSAYLEGEYGLRDLCFGVPVKLGAGGIEAIMEVELTAEEQAAVQVSAEAVRKSIASLGL